MAENMATPREDFPILSIFLARDKRAPVAALYRFARHGDDLADDPTRDAAARRADGAAALNYPACNASPMSTIYARSVAATRAC